MSDQNVNVRVADWHTDKASLRQIRRQVFIEEQKVPEELEWDEFDDSSIHFLASCEGKPVACARLKADGQIGRMAVLAEYRNRGLGRKLLQFILQTSEQKLSKVYLHAQLTAVPFYKKQEFIETGEIFYEANIPHREMFKKVC